MGPPPADPLAEQPWVCSQSFPSPNAEGLSQTKSCTAWLPARLPSWMWPEPLAAGGQPPSRAELWDGEEGCFQAPCACCQGSDGAEHPRARAAPGEVALPLLFSVPVPCPTGPQLFRCTEPEYTVFAQSPRLNKMFMHASAPTNILAGLREACSLPQLQLRRGAGPRCREFWGRVCMVPILGACRPSLDGPLPRNVPPSVPVPPAPL